MSQPNEQQRANLARLAAYLDLLPVDYEHFSMHTYLSGSYDPADVEPADYYSCGTVACAVGHGPAAGIKPITNDRSWAGYAARAFGTYVDEDTRDPLFDWCFNGFWSRVDNTARGAAKRIRYSLSHGVPADFNCVYAVDPKWVQVYADA